MSKLNFLHSGGNKVIISAPDSNPASDRTLKLPSNADGTIITSTSPDADRFKAGEVVQVVTTYFNMSSGNPLVNGTYTSVAATGLTATITPRFSNSKIIFETNITCNLNDEDGHSRWQIYDATNSRVFHNNTYCAAGHFYSNTGEYQDVIIRCVGSAVNTNAMTLAVRVRVNSGGTLNFGWSGSDDRLITMTEIKV
tara:strand:+ start:183 stop:770 length:588 start_codon:yes stop_codon:yes gene_type:complete